VTPSPIDRSVVEDAAIRFWRRHGLVGVVISLCASSTVFAYGMSANAAHHRGLLMTLAVTAFVVSLVYGRCVAAMARSARRITYFYSWSLLLVVLILTGAALDGGAASPLAGLLYLALLYAGMAYPWLGVLGISVIEVGGYLGFCVGDGTFGTHYTGLVSAGLALAGVMATLSAYNRETLQRSERELARRLEVEATYDGLTGCLSRRAFDAALAAEVVRANRYRRSLALLCVDVDHLKEANDTYGHACGDDVLAGVGGMLRTLARQADVVGRRGGDEFAVLLPETTVTDAAELARRFRDAARTLSAQVPVTISIGASAMDGDGSDGPDSLVARADGALYEAKAAGRDRVRAAAASPRHPSVVRVPDQRDDVLSPTAAEV